jgi:hypothetical protein
MSAGPLNTDNIVIVAFVALLAFGVFFRVRRTLGRQHYAPRRMRARIVMLVAVGAMLIAALPTPSGFGGAALGSAAGIALAVLGLRHTKFEKTDAGLFFTPNRWLGLGVTALFVARLGVRMVTAFRIAEATALSGDPPLEHMHRSALTLVFYFLFAGYYAGYYALLLRSAPGWGSE